jgi:hypothetical protein
MKLSLKALAIAGGTVWGGAILLVGLANLIWEGYGLAVLEFAASIYPGYDVEGDVGQVIVGTLYGLLDGAIGGLVFGFIYNVFAGGSGGE